MRNLRVVAFVAALLVVASGCTFWQSANRYAAAPSVVSEPFWCAPTVGGGGPLSIGDCQNVSLHLDFAQVFARAHFRASAAVADGATASPYVAGVGAAFRFREPPSTFDADRPDTLLYDGTGPDAQVAGLEWNVATASAPEGFAGSNDVWTHAGGGVWRLRAWVLRPFQNQPNVFADGHPCLGTTNAIYDLRAACYASTHPYPLQILVSNDDGYNAAGIDAAVEAMRALSNVHVTVSAPATNQSGSGGKTTPGVLTATVQKTLSGYPAAAVNGFPADSVLYALRSLHVNPDLLVSGINEGQNIGPFVAISGTIGAARVGGRASIPTVAVSQGFGAPPDYPTGASELTKWVTQFLLGREGPARSESVVNINVPTCTTGSIRGTMRVPVATSLNDRPFDPSDCLSTVTTFADDVDAFVNGYVTQSSIGT